jgi:hypothetical protein
VLLCVAAGFATLIALVAWSAGSRDDRCIGDCASFELAFQFVLAATGLAVTVAMAMLAARRSYRAAAMAFVVGLAIFAAWAVFSDAATHGWDDLRLLWLGTLGR